MEKNDNYKNGSKNLAWNENLSKRCNHPLLPQGNRGLIIGKSGCGKTTLLINILLRPGWLVYDNINIFGNSLFQPEYHILKKAFEEKLPKKEIIRLFENQNEISKKKNLMVFDDLLLEKQNTLQRDREFHMFFFINFRRYKTTLLLHQRYK